jgi:hypothetical protein
MRPALSLAAVLYAAVICGAVSGEMVTSAAVWHPGAGFLGQFHRQCSSQRGAAFDACFARAMAAAGASPAALGFARRLDNQGYLAALDPTGAAVAIAHVIFPFRANENDAWLLVNGDPPLINVDDRQHLDLARLYATPAYEGIRRNHPNVTFWPGARGRSGRGVSHGGREIVVDYVLRDLCHACAVVGRVRFAFEFSAEGKFLGTRLVSVTPAAD